MIDGLTKLKLKHYQVYDLTLNNPLRIQHIYITLVRFFFENGYYSSFVPKLVKKSEGINDKRLDKSVTRFNYRLTLFTSLPWIYQGFYHKVNGVTVKTVP